MGGYGSQVSKLQNRKTETNKTETLNGHGFNFQNRLTVVFYLNGRAVTVTDRCPPLLGCKVIVHTDHAALRYID